VQAMVALERLSKHFGPVQAVRDVSFTVSRGEVLGFLGPNGAGKTTTMRMITGFVPPSSGTARVLGFEVTQAPLEVKRRVGYLPEGAPLYGDMTVLGFLNFVAEVRGFSGRGRDRRVAAAVERTGLGEVLYQPIETLSKGYKRRVGIAQAILHDPPVLIMDEPTDGLDPNQKHEVRRLIADMAPEKAIIVSTHILEEVDAVCTRAIIIARGRIVADETPDALRRRSRWHNAVRVALDRDRARELLDELARLAGIRSAELLREQDGIAEIALFPDNGAEILNPVRAFLEARDAGVREVVVERGRLDEVFRQLTTAMQETA